MYDMEGRIRMKEKLFGPLPTAIIFILIFRFGGSLGGNPAVNYNDRIVKYQIAITVKILNLMKSLDKGNLEDINKKLERLKIQIDKSLTKLSKMDSFQGYTRLRDAAINMAKFYKSIASKEIVEMVKILSLEDTFISQTDINHLQDIKKDIIDQEVEYGYELQEAQKEFAKIYGLKLTKVPKIDQ
jgi:hypothetical protein